MNTTPLTKFRSEVEQFSKQIDSSAQKNNPQLAGVKQQLAQLRSDLDKASKSAGAQAAVVDKNFQEAFQKIQNQYRKVDPKAEKVSPGKQS